MPCTYEEGPQDRQARQWRLDTMARLACDYCKLLDATGDVPEWADEWWQEHKAMDAARVAREERVRRQAELQVQAMAKLTQDELVALGLLTKRRDGNG